MRDFQGEHTHSTHIPPVAMMVSPQERISTNHINNHFACEDAEQITTAMGNQPGNDLADPALLEKIDKSFELGIGEYVALLQVNHHPILPFSLLINHCSVICCRRSKGRL